MIMVILVLCWKIREFLCHATPLKSTKLCRSVESASQVVKDDCWVMVCVAFQVDAEKWKSGWCSLDLDEVWPCCSRTLFLQIGARRHNVIAAKTLVTVTIKPTPQWVFHSFRISLWNIGTIVTRSTTTEYASHFKRYGTIHFERNWKEFVRTFSFFPFQ